jgi:hypothetical protein
MELPVSSPIGRMLQFIEEIQLNRDIRGLPGTAITLIFRFVNLLFDCRSGCFTSLRGSLFLIFFLF